VQKIVPENGRAVRGMGEDASFPWPDSRVCGRWEGAGGQGACSDPLYWVVAATPRCGGEGR